MTQIIAPSTSYEATLEAGVSGLVGTLELGVYDGDTATEALSALTINEIGTTGVYVATRTSPAAAGQYVLVWSLDGTLDPDQVITEDLLITSTAPAVVPVGDTYADVDELFRILKIRTPSAEQTLAGERVMVAAAMEIAAEIDLADGVDLTSPQLALAAEVNLERAAELWKLQEVQFGIVLGSEFGSTHIARNTWDKYAYTLAPLKDQWGLA